MKNLTLAEIEKLSRDYLTTQDVAVVMGISCVTFYKNYEQMPFPVLRIGRNYRIPKNLFLIFMKTGCNTR